MPSLNAQLTASSQTDIRHFPPVPDFQYAAEYTVPAHDPQFAFCHPDCRTVTGSGFPLSCMQSEDMLFCE